MLDLLLDPGFWAALFSVTLVQIALGADNLIIITILANKLPLDQQKKAVRWGLILAMVFRIRWESTSRAPSAARRSSSSVEGCS
jgi:predicted tellurium resistance membrane protein TerC